MANVYFTPTFLLAVLFLLLSPALAVPHSLYPRSQFCENVPAHKAGTHLDRRSFQGPNLDLTDSFPPTDLLPLTRLLPRLPGGRNTPQPQPPACLATTANDCPNSHLWCAYDSSTWILSTFSLPSPASPPAVQNILSRALAQILLHIGQTSDGPIDHGLYGYIQEPTGHGPDTSTLQLQALPPAGPQLRPANPQPSTPQGLTLTVENANNHQVTWGVMAAAIQALLNLMSAQTWWGAASATVYDGENEVASLILSVGTPGSSGLGASSSGGPSAGTSDSASGPH